MDCDYQVDSGIVSLIFELKKLSPKPLWADSCFYLLQPEKSVNRIVVLVVDDLIIAAVN